MIFYRGRVGELKAENGSGFRDSRAEAQNVRQNSEVRALLRAGPVAAPAAMGAVSLAKLVGQKVILANYESNPNHNYVVTLLGG